MKILSFLLAVSYGLISSDVAMSNESLFTDECVCDRDPIKLLCSVVLGKTSISFPLNKADGTYFTCTCRDGYQQVGDNIWNCEPIDECKLDPNPCPEGAYCVDEIPPQKYTCACKPGYEEKARDAQGATLCRNDPTLIPSSEPSSPAPVPPQQPSSEISDTYVCANDCTGNNKECTNNVCQCKPGYFSTNGADVSAHCEDEDECQENYTPKVRCDRPNKATCINTNGSYHCACKDGWTDADNHAFPGSNCVNVNECVENLDDCDLSTQVCKDFNPPTKWQCLDKTAAPTLYPTRKPTVSPTILQCSQPYLELSSADRNAAYQGTGYCDQNINGGFQGENWYRFTGAAGTQLVTYKPETFYCGTNAPGWLQGSHPTAEEGTVTRTACFNWSGKECNWSTTISIANCGGYYLYLLPNTPTCSLRYCGMTV